MKKTDRMGKKKQRALRAVSDREVKGAADAVRTGGGGEGKERKYLFIWPERGKKKTGQ